MSVFNFGGIGGVLSQAMMNWVFWFILVVVIFGVVIGSLYMKRKGKFIFPAAVFIDNGNGKAGIKFIKAGWFKSRKILGGLIETGGERRLETNDGRIIQQGSSEDFHEINYRVGVILREKSDDPKILIPVSKINIDEKSKEIIMRIAPADYRDASSKIVADAEKESLSKWETLAQVLVFGFVGIILFISIILTIQYSKNTMSEAQAIHKEALQFYEKVIGRTAVAPSTTAP